MVRKEVCLSEGARVYHVFNKSIAGYVIFNNDMEFTRILDVIRFYQTSDRKISFSNFIRCSEGKRPGFDKKGKKLVEIIAYCIMPTHLHLILEELEEEGISIFMQNVQNSYTRYFNLRHKRKGPLWEGRFKNILVESDEQLVHLTRYLHLNPVTAYLVDSPKDWRASSYNEYLSGDENKICRYDHILKIDPKAYSEFVKDNISYQRELARIKGLTLDE